MPNALQKLIEAATAEFARGVIQAIRRASLDDIKEETHAAPKRRGPGRPPKTATVPPSPKRPVGRPKKPLDASDSRIGQVIRYVTANPGTSKSKAVKALNFPAAQWSVYAGRAVKSGKIKKLGERRGTTYWPA